MKKRLIGGVLTAGALVIAASAPASAQAPKQPRQCFSASSVHGFTPVDDERVNLHVGVKDSYQLTLAPGCREIDWTWSLGIRTRGGGSFICQGLDAEIVVPDRNFPQRCLVSSVRKLSSEEASASKRVRARKTKP